VPLVEQELLIPPEICISYKWRRFKSWTRELRVHHW
jgi:hypothetical protein